MCGGKQESGRWLCNRLVSSDLRQIMNSSKTHLSTEASVVCASPHILDALNLLKISTFGSFPDFLLKTKSNCAKKFVCLEDTNESLGGMEQRKELKINIGYLVLRIPVPLHHQELFTGHFTACGHPEPPALG